MKNLLLIFGALYLYQHYKSGAVGAASPVPSISEQRKAATRFVYMDTGVTPEMGLRPPGVPSVGGSDVMNPYPEITRIMY